MRPMLQNTMDTEENPNLDPHQRPEIEPATPVEYPQEPSEIEPDVPEIEPTIPEIEPSLPAEMPMEMGGYSGPEPTQYGDWQQNGRVSDF